MERRLDLIQAILGGLWNGKGKGKLDECLVIGICESVDG